MSLNKNDVYGASLVLSYYLRKKFPDLGNEMRLFISLLEFDKYTRYRDYDMPLKEVHEEIIDDIWAFNKFSKVDIPKGLTPWLKVNFEHMWGMINGDIDEELFS